MPDATDTQAEPLDTPADRDHGGDGPRGARWRRPVTVVLAVTAALSLVLAVTATWVNRTLLDTDQWIEAVEPLPQDPELQQIVAQEVADEVLTVIDLPNLMEGLLGSAGRFLAVPAQDAARSAIEQTTVDVLASPEFEQVWIEINRLAHEAAVKVLLGESSALTTVDGQVTLDLVPLINNVIAEISQNTPELFGGAISVPEVTPDQVGQAATDLADALGITLPPDFGQVPVFDAGALTTAQDVVQLLDTGVIALWIIFVLAVVGALVASIDRRGTVVFLGVVTTITAVIVWVLRRPLEGDIVDQIKNPTGKQATQIVIEVALWRNLGALIAWLVTVSLLAAAVAFLIGPSRYAVAVRTSVRGLFSGDDHEQTPVGAFIRRHTAAFRILGAAAALVALISIPELTWGWFLAITGVLVAYEASWMYITPLDPAAAEPDATIVTPEGAS